VLEAKTTNLSLKKEKKIIFDSSEAEEEEDVAIPGFLLQSYENKTWPVRPHLTQESAGMDMQAYLYKELWQGKEGEFLLLFRRFCFLLRILKIPIQILVRKDLHFPHAAAVSMKKRCHLRSERKGGDSACLHFSTAYLQSVCLQQFFPFKNS